MYYYNYITSLCYDNHKVGNMLINIKLVKNGWP